MLEHTLKFIGSIKLAVPLLSMIVAILIGATFYESQVGSTTVQQEIYKSPWFGALMFLLALNLAVSALYRYPWRGARKIGFALTHLGIIVIIAGSAAVIHLGVEGMLPLRTDMASSNQIRVEGELLEVMTPSSQLQQTDVLIKPDGSVIPKQIGKLSLVGYSDKTIKTVSFTEGATADNLAVDNPAVRLRLKSDRMGQTLERYLAVAPVAYSKVGIGPAELEIIQVETVATGKGKSLLSPPEQQNLSPWGSIEVTSKETDKIDTEIIDIKQALSSQAPDSSVKVIDFWPDFRLDANNQPTTASQQLRNPAVQLEVSTPEGVERWFVFGKENFPPIRSVVSGKPLEGIEISYNIQPQESEDYFRVIVTQSGQLFYAAHSSKGFKSGTLEVGKAVSPGWADFQITLDEYIPHGKINREVIPVFDPSAKGVPALLVSTETGTQTWLPWGEPTTINEPTGEIFAAFSPKLLQLPFAIALEDFIVERNEGSDSVAMWTSKIRIEDRDHHVISHRNVWMNHPTWYQGWKIAQASWNPGDLKQSTLQIKREPAWVTALTWTGSGLVISGITIMFYGRGVAKKLRRQPEESGVPLYYHSP
ncbi:MULTISPECIES: cytochrome c biogenesis protein ResB [Moorena]|uniref:ResB-like domain-containing protein n=1 Tax=Moorena producens 3L TaxID=489825 RepID=F4Y0R9_9CYAN|nr:MULTISPECIES: cytochrome c biogenesis protein ResB [Moorena]EGJ29430.1 hypothetical protein LYNGBM3L_63580 [Moorena producens 3L]NEP68358.1 cytochrome c biogenesis protein ResB [Moorena sp. SIO3A5]OLT66063.1 cytochrome C biogenesis protein [Moorena producens 3L]